MVFALVGTNGPIFDARAVGPNDFSARGEWVHFGGPLGLQVAAVSRELHGADRSIFRSATKGALLFGRLSNASRLRQLSLLQSAAKAPSDAEIVAELFERLGSSGLELLDGSCAGLAFNEQRATLFAGKCPGQPIYYKAIGSSLAFSSELKVFARSLGSEGDLNPIDAKLLEVRPDLTPFRGCYRLLPGTALDLSDCDGVKPLSYVPATSAASIKEEAEAKRSLLLALDQAVAAWASGESVTCLISGGVDSAIVSVLAAKHAKSLRLASIDLGGRNEFDRADRVADLIGTRCERLYITEAELLEGFACTVKHAEHWMSQYIEYLAPFHLGLRKLTNDGSIVLSGYGSDILFGGMAARGLDEAGIAAHVAHEWATSVWANEFSSAIGGSLGFDVGYPFFDSAVISVWKRIPTALRYRPEGNKHFLRQSVEGALTPNIAWQEKIGIHESTGFETLISQQLSQSQTFNTSRSTKDEFARAIWAEVILNARDPSDIDYSALLHSLTAKEDT